MNRVHCLPIRLRRGGCGATRTAESSIEDCRQKTQKTQELSRFSIGIATFVHFRGHSIGARFPVRLGSRRSDQSNWVKVGQTSLVGQAGASNLCKYFKMNSLQHNQPQSGLTGINLVTHGQNKPIRFGLRPVRRCQIEGRPVSGPKIWSCAGRGGCYSSGSRANGLRGGFSTH